MICFCLTGQTIEENLRLCERHARHADLVELRADFLSAGELGAACKFPTLLAERAPGMAAILTIRRQAEGGRYGGDERRRVEALAQGVGAGFSFVDLEHDLHAPSIDASLRHSAVTVIRSRHDTTHMRPDPARELGALPRNDLELPKLAAHVAGFSDAARMMLGAVEYAALHGQARRDGSGEAHRERPGGESRFLMVGMGPYGVPTRILARRLGCAWSYASASGEAAPGQLSPEVLDTLYRVRSHGPRTGVLCVIGDPIEHSRSPEFHNARLVADKRDAVYVPMRVDDFDAWLQLAHALPITGASVTVPLKEQALLAAERRDDAAEAVGAANTLLRTTGGGYMATNTDVAGFLAPFAEMELPRHATVIGAGGAARAVVFALLKQGCHVTIVNRTHERADKLAESMRSLTGLGRSMVKVLPLDDLGEVEHGALVVQTTTVGMTPEEEADPCPRLRFRGDELVYDIVYTPEYTRFRRRAEAAGCRTISGRRMFEGQGQEQYRLFATAARFD